MLGGGLPGAYRRVEYLESSGTQAINTGITPSSEFYVKFDLINTYENGNSGLGGAKEGGTWGVYCYMSGEAAVSDPEKNNRSGCAYGHNNVYTSNKNSLFAGQRYLIEYRLSPSQGLQVYINGVLQSTNTYDDPTVSIPWYLFANNTDGRVDTSRVSKIKLFSLEMGKQNQIVRNLVPCVRKSDNKPGMYDTVSHTFYTNAGTGEFIVPN